MAMQQADNFIAILRTACGNGQRPLQAPDWRQLADWARSQSLTALFYTGASQYAEFQACDAAERARLQRETITTVAAQAQRTRRFWEAYQSMLAAGFRPLVLKGIVCRSLYGDLADYRPSCDEDFYLPPEQAEKCRTTLEQSGWQLTSHAASLTRADQLQEIAFDDTTGVLHLELHPTLFGTNRPDLLQATNWFYGAQKRAVPMSLSGQTLYTLHPTDHYLYLFLHLAKHFRGKGVGVRQVMDLAKFQAAYRQDINWNTVYKAVGQLSSPELYNDAMSIARKLGFAAEGTGPGVDPQKLLLDSLEGGIYGHDRAGNDTGVLINAALQYPGITQRVRHLFFPSAEQLFESRPYLVKKPWLLPAAWLDRFRKLGKRGFGRETRASLASANKHARLLDAYGLIPGRRKRSFPRR